MRIGFLVWNQFQVAHGAEIARHFEDPEFIFIDRNPAALSGFDPSWLVPYGAYSRFPSELELHQLDGEYDAIVTQFRPPLTTPWTRTKLVMHQYSLAKPKTAYNARWFVADRGLVYGAYSESIIGSMCPVSAVGNPRFDPYFEGRLDPRILADFRKRLDPAKKTILYLPTWGDLGMSKSFSDALGRLADEFNVILKPHHLTGIRDDLDSSLDSRIIHAATFPPVLDPGLYLHEIADVIVSDMSGAIFDAMYCRKPVVLVGEGDAGYTSHCKADDSAIEVSQRHRIGPYVYDPDGLGPAIRDQLTRFPYRDRNEELVAECFSQRGGGASMAAKAIRATVELEAQRPFLQVYAAPDFAANMMSRAAAAAKKRKRADAEAAQGTDYPASLVRIREFSRRNPVSDRFARLAAGPVRALLPGRDAAVDGSRAAGAGKPMSMKALAQAGRFFEAGRGLERWRKRMQRDRAKALYQAQSVVSAVRFSPMTWKRNLSKLFEGVHAPSTTAGSELLQQLGMLKSAAAWYARRNVSVPQELQERIVALGPLAGVIDVAARNEVADKTWQMCIAPGGATVPLAAVESGQAIELFLLSSLIRDLKDEGRRPYRATQLQFSQHLVSELLGLGFHVYPRLQAGVDGATAVSLGRPAFTWHTIDAGREGQFHLKIGTLFGHFIVDSKGYSGWSSIADGELHELVSDVDQDAADAHWRKLHADLVEGAVSKYSQSVEPPPTGIDEYVFLPMQVADDTVAKLADIDTSALLGAMVLWARKSGTPVVVKRHPMCKSPEVAELIGQAERAGHIRVSNANIHQLIAGASCVVTVNSGVGAEALVQLKPVVTTGRSDYAPATHRVGTIGELHALLDEKPGLPADEGTIRKFLWYYTNRYSVPSSDAPALRSRLHELLAGAGYAAAPVVGDQPAFATADGPPGVTSIPFTTTIGAAAEAGVPTQAEGPMLGEACHELLDLLASEGARCWLDSGSLLGLVRHGRLNHWEKDIDLGIWFDDYEAARKACSAIAAAHSLWYREKRIDGIPYALLLSSHPGEVRTTLPIAVHLFFRMGDDAWSVQPHSLVSARSKYPRYVYREANGAARAKLGQKFSFLARHPLYSLSIAMEKLNLTTRIGRRLRQIERADNWRDRLLLRLFVETFQWKIPARFFDELRPFADEHPDLLVPADTDGYLAARYGDWRVPVQDWFYLVDDACIGPIPKRELAERLAEAGRHASRSMQSEAKGV